MKVNLIASIGFLFLIGIVYAGDFEKGVKEFEAKQYSEAIIHFQSAIEKEPKNANAYYNLGCAQFEISHIGQAIWSFEKVIQLDPKNSNALNNLEVCHNKLELPPYESIESGAMRNLTAFGSTNWAIVSICCALLIAFSLIAIKKSVSVNIRRLSLLLIFLGLSIGASSIYMASYTISIQENSNIGIIVEKRIQTYDNGPKPKESGIFLSEGTRILNIRPNKNGFVVGNLSNGTEVIVKADGIKRL